MCCARVVFPRRRRRRRPASFLLALRLALVPEKDQRGLVPACGASPETVVAAMRGAGAFLAADLCPGARALARDLLAAASALLASHAGPAAEGGSPVGAHLFAVYGAPQQLSTGGGGGGGGGGGSALAPPPLPPWEAEVAELPPSSRGRVLAQRTRALFSEVGAPLFLPLRPTRA